ncbi:MAG: hypothetical protein ACI8ZM_002241 [Crocinitomix sp.]|jgi:hypothetical protein
MFAICVDGDRKMLWLRYICSISFLLAFSNLSSAQDRSEHRLFFEGLGSAGFGSFNYEKRLMKLDRDKSEFVFRTGLSAFPGDANIGTTIVLPNSFNYLYGQAHKLELGIGQTLSVRLKGALFIRTVFNVGYRFQKPDKAVFYRLTYTPLMSNVWDVQFQHWGGFSIGYQFLNK